MTYISEAPLDAQDPDPDFEARPDVELISEYLNKNDAQKISEQAINLAPDFDMLSAMLSVDQAQLDALAAICLPIAVFAQTWRDEQVRLLRRADIFMQEIEHSKRANMSAQEFHDEDFGEESHE